MPRSTRADLSWCPSVCGPAGSAAVVLMGPSGQAAPPLLEEKTQSLSSSVQLSCCQIPVCNTSHGPSPAESLLLCLDTQRGRAERFLPAGAVLPGWCYSSGGGSLSSPPAWADFRGVSGLSLGDDGGLCVGSFPDPSPAEGRGRRAPFAGGAGRHGTLPPIPGALLEEGPGEQGEFYPQAVAKT